MSDEEALRLRAANDLAQLQDHRHDVVRLARVASLAVGLEGRLLRRLRLELLPDADVGVEAIFGSAPWSNRGPPPPSCSSRRSSPSCAKRSIASAMEISLPG